MATTSSTSYLERIQDFVTENKKAILVGSAAAALAVGGVIYYASTRSPGGDLEKGKSRDKKKSSKKRKTVNDTDGPILEEIKPKVVEVEGQFHSSLWILVMLTK